MPDGEYSVLHRCKECTVLSQHWERKFQVQGV